MDASTIVGEWEKGRGRKDLKNEYQEERGKECGGRKEMRVNYLNSENS